MKRYMTSMVTLVALLLAFVSTPAFAQATKISKATAAAPATTGTAAAADKAKVGEEEQLVQLVRQANRFPYRNPGQDPVLRESEFRCAFGPEQNSIDQLEIIALWRGDYDNCTDAPRLAINKRLTQRYYQLNGAKDEQGLNEDLIHLHNGEFTRIEYKPAKIVDGKLVTEGKMPDLPEMYGSDALGTRTDVPFVPIGFTMQGLRLPAVAHTTGDWVGKPYSLVITTSFVKDGKVKVPCVNFTGEFGEISEATAGPAEQPASTAPAPTAVATVPQHAPDLIRPKKSGFTVDFGVEFDFGSHQSAYSGAVQPGTGDATQHNSFRAIRPVIRVEPRHGKGVVASMDVTLLDKTGPKTFDDPVTKIRDTDTTKDTRREFFGGYQFNLGGADVAVIAGMHTNCLCENYTAQGAATTTKRSYTFVDFGAQAKFAVAKHADLRLRGTYGRGNRTQWTQQVYPGVNFPRVDQPKASASAIGLRAEVSARLMGPLGLIATYDYTHISSQRTNTFAAHESVNLGTASVGIVYRLGK